MNHNIRLIGDDKATIHNFANNQDFEITVERDKVTINKVGKDIDEAMVIELYEY